MTRMTKQPEPFAAEFFVDSVGRRRKLSNGAMQRICMEYADGVTATQLAKEYGVSVGLIRTVVYHTPRTKDLSRVMDARYGMPAESRQVKEPTKKEDNAEAHATA